MSMDFEPNGEELRSRPTDRRREADFAERVGRGLTSAADLLARLGKKQIATVAATAPARAWSVDELATTIARTAARFLDAESIDTSTDFFELGATSVQAVELLATLSRELGVKIELDDLFADARPRRLAERWLNAARDAGVPVTSAQTALTAKPAPEVAVSSVNARERSPRAHEDLQAIEADLRLADTLPWVGPATFATPRRILLTGATGFLGSHMLFDLLRRSDAHVVCLVRGRDQAQAEARLFASLRERELPCSPELQRRMSVLVGDIAAPRLGLSDAQWDALAHDVDCIVNVAAAVDFMRGYASLRKSNVLGPLTLATLASTGPIKSLHQVSTISIFDELGIRSVAEDDPPAHVDRLFAGYETTKWAAEAVLRRARERGLPMSLYRPGGIVGHTVTGVYNPHDLSSGFMAAWQALRALPAFRHMHAAPVDWVSRIISELVLDPSSWGYNYHVTGEPISMQRMTRDMALSGMNVRVVGFETWRQMFFERMERDPIPSLEFLKRALQSPATLHLVQATLNSPAARADRTEAYIRRRKLPSGRYDPRTAIATTERLVRDGRASLPGRDDTPYLRFRETLRGELASDTGEASACEIDLEVSMASFYQLLRERRVDLRGVVRCAALHPEPLVLESGDSWFRPDEGVPELHGLEHPLMRYRFVARAADGRRFLFEGKKYTRPGRDQWRQGRTLQLTVAPQGHAPTLRGQLVVPADSFVPDQIDGIAVNGASPQHRGIAKLIWLVWFNAQFGLAFSEPMLRGLVQLFDVSRGTTREGGT